MSLDVDNTFVHQGVMAALGSKQDNPFARDSLAGRILAPNLVCHSDVTTWY